MHQASCAMWNKMSFKIVESWYEDKLVSHTSIQMMQYSLYVVKDSNRFPQSLQMEKVWECEAAGIKPNTNLSIATCTSQTLEMAECGIQPLEQLLLGSLLAAESSG
jgi:formate dehydrogenase maturation protein FdhE